MKNGTVGETTMIDEQDLDHNGQDNELDTETVGVCPDQALLPEFPDLARSPAPEQAKLF